MIQASNRSGDKVQAAKTKDGFDPYHKWLGIPTREQPPNHYRLLGIDLFEADLDVINSAAIKQIAFVRQCAIGPHAEASQKVLNDLSAAQICLLNPDQKTAYDAQLKAELDALAKSQSASAEVETPAETKSSPRKTAAVNPANDAKLKQQTQKLDKLKKQAESLLKQCEFASAIDILENMTTVKHPKLAKYSRWAKQKLPAAKRGPQEMRESSGAFFRTGEQLFERNDYEQAAEILQQVPKKYRNSQTKELLQECLDRQAEIVVLLEDIEHAESLEKYDDLIPTVERLLELKPNDRRAKKLLKELNTYGKGGGGMRLGHGDGSFDAVGSTFDSVKAVLFIAVPLAIFGAVSWATVVYIKSDNKTIKIEIDDPAATVIIDGDVIKITGVGDTVTLKRGKHELIVERGDLIVHTRQFKVVKGKNPVLRITLTDIVASIPKDQRPKQASAGTAGPATLPEPVLSVTFDEGPDSELRLDNRGTTFVDGKIGRALKCDGKSFMVAHATLPEGSSPRTIAAWLKNSGISGDTNLHTIAYGSTTPPSLAFGIFHLKNQWGHYGWGNQVSTEADVDDKWHHHCLSYDGEEIIYRFDGRIVSQVKGTLATTAGPLVLGQYADPNRGVGFAGLIDDVLIYDTALTSEQVRVLIEKQVTPAGTASPTPPAVAVDGASRILKGHTGAVYAVAFSSDGKSVVSCGYDVNARLWDVATGREIRQFIAGDGGIVFSVAFSPDGKLIATSGTSSSHIIQLWDAATGRELRQLRGHTGTVQAVAFSADGRGLASGGRDKSIRLWNVATGKQIGKGVRATIGITSISFSPDAKKIVAGSGTTDGGHVYAYDATNGRLVMTTSGHSDYVLSFAISSDGRRVLSGSIDNSVHLSNMRTGKVIRKFVGHTDIVGGVAFLADEQYVVSGSYDGTLRFWDTKTGKEVHRFESSTGKHGVRGVAVSPDGSLIATAGRDSQVRLWRIPSKFGSTVVPAVPDAD